MNYDDPSPRYRHHGHAHAEPPFVTDAKRTGHRLWAYLRTRPAESWLFFAAGFVIAVVLN